MSTKSNDLSASVPILTGPNWIIWEAQMKVYLRTKGLWQLVIGNEMRPANLPTGRHPVMARPATDTHPARDAVTVSRIVPRDERERRLDFGFNLCVAPTSRVVSRTCRRESDHS